MFINLKTCLFVFGIIDLLVIVNSTVSFSEDPQVRTGTCICQYIGTIQAIGNVMTDSAGSQINILFTYTSATSGSLKLSLGLYTFYFFQIH